MHKVARDIANESIYTRHVRDNVTVIVVAINRGVRLNEWFITIMLIC